MKIVKPSATLLSITSNAEKLIERAGRTCYKSEDKITEDSSAEFIRMLIKRGHESVLEHASATILFVCDRGVSHKLVRHRIASYSQESTRYCKYKGDLYFIYPDCEGKIGYEAWQRACKSSEIEYGIMIKSGCPPQIARSVLPTCLKTEIVMTANFREWRHVFKLRLSKAAHPQIREIMEKAQVLLRKECPNVFEESQ